MNVPGPIKSFLLGLSLVAGLTGCIYDHHHSGHDHSGHVGFSYQPYYYPHYYDYYYYPSVHVYFSYSTGHYYYPHGKSWIRAKVLPQHIRLDSRERVVTRVEGDKPYLKNKQHIRKFKARSDYRSDAKLHRKEKDQNAILYKRHQQDQRVYKDSWQKRKKKDKKRY